VGTNFAISMFYRLLLAASSASLPRLEDDDEDNKAFEEVVLDFTAGELDVDVLLVVAVDLLTDLPVDGGEVLAVVVFVDDFLGVTLEPDDFLEEAFFFADVVAMLSVSLFSTVLYSCTCGFVRVV
jgi:hypothetical protein